MVVVFLPMERERKRRSFVPFCQTLFEPQPDQKRRDGQLRSQEWKASRGSSATGDAKNQWRQNAPAKFSQTHQAQAMTPMPSSCETGNSR